MRIDMTTQISTAPWQEDLCRFASCRGVLYFNIFNFAAVKPRRDRVLADSRNRVPVTRRHITYSRWTRVDATYREVGGQGNGADNSAKEGTGMPSPRVTFPQRVPQTMAGSVSGRPVRTTPIHPFHGLDCLSSGDCHDRVSEDHMANDLLIMPRVDVTAIAICEGITAGL